MEIDSPPGDADAIICVHCEAAAAEIYEVAFTESDKLYQFVCQREHHSVDDANPIHSAHIFAQYPEMMFLKHVGRNFVARRIEKGNGWELKFINLDEVEFDDE